MRLIDADALIEALGLDQYNNGEGMTSDEEWIAEAITTAPTIEAEPVRRGQWIPCSERLPEDDTLMLVNYIDNRPDAGDIWIGWHEMANVWYIDGEEHSKERGNEVVAWMPLPEPYCESKMEEQE
ncbi:MAG: DUF551 domain-containing protein [Clostridia bacterium]|nr:DUF551 domain-containing protein [Clostridia bacterium]